MAGNLPFICGSDAPGQGGRTAPKPGGPAGVQAFGGPSLKGWGRCD